MPRPRNCHNEISTAGELRRKALRLERCASSDRFYGHVGAADRQAAVARRLREMAALVEVGPFESAYRGPAALARMVSDVVRGRR